MNQEKIDRINELYRKSKTVGLTAEEKEEQAKLRKEYVEAIRANMRSNLDRVVLVNPDGSQTMLSDVRKKNKKD